MTAPKTTQTKNITKGDSFTFVFRRINEAIANEYYLEAITLCESIISDRLLSHVSFHKKIRVNNKTSLGNLIEYAKKIHIKPIQWKEEINLLVAVDEWRIARNECVHSAAKSLPTEPTMSVASFVELSKKSATQGKKLARSVCDWHRFEKNKGGKK